LIYTI